MIKLGEVIVKPMVTEKGMLASAEGKYLFQVHPKANKIDIKKAIEKFFGVKVQDVNTIKNKGKTRRYGRVVGTTGISKKAYVKLMPGYDLNDLFSQ